MKLVVSSCNTQSLATFRLDMMLFFVEKGFKVYALGDEESEEWESFFSQYNIEYLSVRCNRNGTSLREDFQYYNDLKHTLKTIDPDFIFTYQLKSNLYGGFAKPKNAKLITLFAGLGSIFMTPTAKNKVLKRLMYIPMKLSLRKSDYILFHNEDNEKVMIDSGLVKKSQTHVIQGSGVNLKEFPYSPKSENKLKFLYLGRLLEDKGVREYMEAAKRVKEDYPDVEFLLVGNFDTNPSSLSEDDVLEYRKYVDYLGETKKPYNCIRESSVFVYPSYHEGLPKAVVEAMAVGRPVITTEVPGCKETVVDQKNGYLIPKQNVDALMETMIKFIEMSPDQRTSMGLISRRMAEEKFSSEVINNKIYKIIREEDYHEKFNN